jgi:hypothetical protein
VQGTRKPGDRLTAKFPPVLEKSSVRRVVVPHRIGEEFRLRLSDTSVSFLNAPKTSFVTLRLPAADDSVCGRMPAAGATDEFRTIAIRMRETTAGTT